MFLQCTHKQTRDNRTRNASKTTNNCDDKAFDSDGQSK